MKGIVVLKDYDEDALYKVQKTDVTMKFHDIPGADVKPFPEFMPLSTNIKFDNPENLTLGQIWQEGYNYCLRELLGEGEVI